MSEAEFRIFNHVFELGAGLLHAFFLTAFLRPFVQKRVIAGAGYVATYLLCDWLAAPQGVFGLTVIALLAFAFGSQGFLLAVLYWNARISSGLIAESLYFLAEQAVPFQAEPLGSVYLRAAFLITLFFLSHAALMAVMLYALQRRLKKQRIALHRRELCYLCLVPAAGILFGQVISRLLIEFKDGVLLQLYERHPAFLALIPVLALLFCAGSYLTITFQQDMAALREEQALRSRIEEMERFYAQIRQQKHEMRGHLMNIRGLSHSGEYASLEDYISRIDESMSDFELTLQTGNPVTDVIVNDTRRRSLDLGVHFQVDFHYPEPGAYDAFDVGIILQNLLQNAIEACEKVSEGERLIVLTGKRKGHFFLIEVKNSFMGEVVFGQDGLPVTTKTEDAPMHGLGLSNVRRVAEKYMGELELTTHQREFSATVLLQERS